MFEMTMTKPVYPTFQRIGKIFGLDAHRKLEQTIDHLSARINCPRFYQMIGDEGKAKTPYVWKYYRALLRAQEQNHLHGNPIPYLREAIMIRREYKKLFGNPIHIDPRPVNTIFRKKPNTSNKQV